MRVESGTSEANSFGTAAAVNSVDLREKGNDGKLTDIYSFMYT